MSLSDSYFDILADILGSCVKFWRKFKKVQGYKTKQKKGLIFVILRANVLPNFLDCKQSFVCFRAFGVQKLL